MTDGWISVHRKIMDNPVVTKDAEHFAVWSYLLLNATHEERGAMFNGERIILKPGQLITGRKAIANAFNISESKVQRILKTFEIEQQIEQQTCTKNRLITVVNWKAYQNTEQRIEQQVNNKRTTTEQQLNTNNNEIINNNIDISKDISSSHSDYSEIIRLWNSLDGLGNIKPIRAINPNSKRRTLVRARLKEYGMDGFKEVVENIRKSEFLQGKTKDWTATFDWVIKPTQFAKVLEGNYEDTTKSTSRKSFRRFTE